MPNTFSAFPKYFVIGNASKSQDISLLICDLVLSCPGRSCVSSAGLSRGLKIKPMHMFAQSACILLAPTNNTETIKRRHGKEAKQRGKKASVSNTNRQFTSTPSPNTCARLLRIPRANLEIRGVTKKVSLLTN